MRTLNWNASRWETRDRLLNDETFPAPQDEQGNPINPHVVEDDDDDDEEQ